MRRWLLLNLVSFSAVVLAAAAPSTGEPFAERLAAAKSVKIRADILGVGIDSSLEQAHTKLDPLAAPNGQPRKETEKDEEGEQKVLWRLQKSEFSSVFVKVDRQKRVTYILATLRPGKQIPFDQIAELKKAPVRNDKVIAWDVVRENRPLIRVVARGADRKAETITIFLVKRPKHP